jgi:hypothetical protein
MFAGIGPTFAMSSIAANLVPSLTQLELMQPLAVRLFREQLAPPLAEIPVVRADLADVASEAWRDGCLRSGHPGVPLGQTPMRLSPILAEGSNSRCLGLNLELTLPEGRITSTVFTFHSLSHLADRAMVQLVQAGTLKSGESCFFEVVVDSRPRAKAQSAQSESTVTVSLRSALFSYLTVSLRGLIERSEPVALMDAEAPPVFYTQEAFSRAEACARRGEPAGVETGGALFGSLAACPKSGEFFCIVHDVIDVQDAQEKKFSLAYSSRTWLRLQKIQQARQAAFPGRAERLLGQAHGHPFRPNDGRVCAECAKRITCSLTSAWASQDDQIWHNAVFTRQPWALCHIFGLSARGDPVHQLFGLKDGRLQPRGFYLLPDFAFD